MTTSTKQTAALAPGDYVRMSARDHGTVRAVDAGPYICKVWLDRPDGRALIVMAGAEVWQTVDVPGVPGVPS